MNLVEFKNGIVAKANANTNVASESEISLGTIFNIVNSRPTYAGAGFARLKTTSKANFNAKGNYWLVNIGCTTTQRRQWALRLVGELAMSLGVSAKGLTEQQVVEQLNGITLVGTDAKYAREILNAVTAVAITRKADFIAGQFVDCSWNFELSVATGLQEIRFTSMVAVQAEIAKPTKVSALSMFGDAEELEDNVADDVTKTIFDELGA